jgi:hypothetical protein
MDIEADARIPFARERVFAAYRDRLVELVPYLPNIVRIVVVERREREAGHVDLVNEWVGGGEIPEVARRILGDRTLSWLDHASWRAADFTCRWRTEVRVFPGAVHAAGDNRFFEDGPGRTRLAIRGALRCDADALPVPRLLAGAVASAVEKMLVGRIAQNLRAVAAGVARLLEEGS